MDKKEPWEYRHRWHASWFEMKEHPENPDEVWATMSYLAVGAKPILIKMRRCDMDALHYSLGLYLNRDEKNYSGEEDV